MARRTKLQSLEQSRFNAENIMGVAKDLKSGRLPLDKTQLADDLVTGLRATVMKTGVITWSVQYDVGDSRPFMKIGQFNDPKADDYLTLDQARELTRTIKALGNKGINPQDGLLKRLVFELQRDGANWKLPKGL